MQQCSMHRAYGLTRPRVAASRPMQPARSPACVMAAKGFGAPKKPLKGVLKPEDTCACGSGANYEVGVLWSALSSHGREPTCLSVSSSHLPPYLRRAAWGTTLPAKLPRRQSSCCGPGTQPTPARTLSTLQVCAPAQGHCAVCALSIGQRSKQHMHCTQRQGHLGCLPWST